jgi:chromosomal replication initiation ATPase DnaA
MAYAVKKKPKVYEYLTFPLELPKTPSSKPRIVPFVTIPLAVADYFRLGLKELMGRDRHRRAATARHITIYLASIHTRLSVAQISVRMGRDHTTGLYAVAKIASRLVTTPGLVEVIRAIEERLP